MNTGMHAVLAPVSRDQFQKDYWESRPLHVARSNSDYFSSLLSINDIESVLSTRELYFPSVQLTQKDHTFKAGDYADAQQRILGLRLMQLHAQGATVVLSQAQSLFASLDVLCREVMQWMKMRCQTNVYLSPPGYQGFNAHYDTHDVFILQVSGAKTFNFYSQGVDLPFTDDQFDRSAIDSLQLTESIHMQAGDTLYIPRGLVHDAVANEQASLHVTLGLFPVILRDLLQEIVQVAAERDRRFRQTVFPANPEISAAFEQLPALIGELDDSSLLDEALLRQQEQLSLCVAQDASGALVNTQHGDSLTHKTLLVLKPRALISCQRTGNRIVLHGLGQVLEFDEVMTEAAALIAKGDTFYVGDLPGLSKVQQIALCKQLLRENLLQITDEPA